jgi:transposase
MSKPLVSDELWTVIEPLLPPEPPRPKGGRPQVPDRAPLTGIIFVFKSGIPWEMGSGSGVTCWRRLRDWQAAGVWECLHQVLLNRLGEADRIDWSRASLDSAALPAQRGAKRPGSKHHLVVDRQEVPLPVMLTGANVHDSLVFAALIDGSPPIKRPRKRPAKLHADKGSDYRKCRQAVMRRRIRVRIARKGIESSERLGCHRWVVEPTLAWLNRFRRLTVC